ncbi:MAG: hypothetical protein A3F14_04080 [Gammaproteobacteria bacterium RIFCSPHIGHO2_12_FULL_43_28]|nr:MAG: hypothetical protein A3F14_04080 [Gammaproteobacteria bacterium RIFCSPHIGHO2_12_FULL_43_28]
MTRRIFKLGLLPTCLFMALSANAATPIDLGHQPVSFLAKMSEQGFLGQQIKFNEVSRSADFNQTLHVRLKQTYLGYPVFGGDAVVHTPNANNQMLTLNQLATPAASMNGKIYQDLQRDLTNAPAFIFETSQAVKARQEAIKAYQQKSAATPAITNQQSHLMVYIDKNNKAHWAYQVSFDAAPVKAEAMPEKPIYILDAFSFEVYEQWNNLQTIEDTMGGGFGGNKKMGKVTYDNLKDHLPQLEMTRDENAMCYLQNADVTVHDRRKNDEVIQFACKTKDQEHNNLYWDGQLDYANGGYSPANDALFEGAVIKKMYQDWYHLPVLEKAGKPMMLDMVVHEKMDNAYWDGERMVFGDGVIMFYPLTSLDVAAHEISHGFTEQHANLVYEKQSGGMNEAFSDMASQAAEFYAHGKNNWKIGSDIVWIGDALRYMDKPSKDCSWMSSTCSIDDASKYTDSLDVHYTSGVYNRFFYLIATTKGWDTKKAFNVMVQANQHYWTPNTTFVEGACGVLKATKDYKYDVDAVKAAAKTVAIDTSTC